MSAVVEWLEKVGLRIPKGSKFTKRYGKSYSSKFTLQVGKLPRSNYIRTKLSELGSVEDWKKTAVGTGDDDYSATSTVGSYGHKHVHGEAECHLCKGTPIFISERNECDTSKEATSHDSVEYHEILKIVAEAHGVDLTKPESLDLLPALLREADHILMKHEKLETAEDEMNEQLMGNHERPE